MCMKKGFAINYNKKADETAGHLLKKNQKNKTNHKNPTKQQKATNQTTTQNWTDLRKTPYTKE